MEQSRTDKITPKMMLAIINPGPVVLSALLPALTAVLFVVEEGRRLYAPLVVVLLMIALLANSVADLLNDYYDYVKGTDKPDNTLSEEDSPLAWNNIKDPRPVLYLAILFTVLILLLGAYVIYRVGTAPLWIAAVGILVMLLYSGKYISLSGYPLGEILSGGCLGGLLPLGVYTSLTGVMNPVILWKSLPMILTVSSLCLANNTCDIERDTESGRHTLPILIGRKSACTLAKVLHVIWMVQMAFLVVTWYPFGISLFIVLFILTLGPLKELMGYERTFEEKARLMGSLGKASFLMMLGYPLIILMHILIRNSFM